MQLKDFILLNINGQRLFSRELRDFNVFKELDKIFDHYRYGSFNYRAMRLDSILFDTDCNFELKLIDESRSLMGVHDLKIHNYEITNKTTLLEMRKELVKCLTYNRLLTNYNFLPYLSEDDITGIKMLEELVS